MGPVLCCFEQPESFWLWCCSVARASFSASVRSDIVSGAGIATGKLRWPYFIEDVVFDHSSLAPAPQFHRLLPARRPHIGNDEALRCAGPTGRVDLCGSCY